MLCMQCLTGSSSRPIRQFHALVGRREPFFQETGPWRGSQSGENYLTRLVGNEGIPDGTYTVDLFVGQIPLASTQVQVGIGQLPIDRLAEAGGIQLRGQVLDAYTRQGIPGVTLMLLSAEYSVEDFDWNEDKIYALAVTDRTGRFQIDRPLELGAPYSMICCRRLPAHYSDGSK
jgi:hypothetical protein